MRYGEFSEHPLREAFIDPNEDRLHKADPDDTRKPRLTLRQVNKLKKIRATNDLENAKKDSILGVMYGLSDDDDSGGGF